MTKIVIIKSGDAVNIDMAGHCEAAEGGQDRVCAAVSMLVCTLARSLLDGAGKGLVEGLCVRMESGSAYFHYRTRDAEMRTALDNVTGGFSMLSENYPQNVKLILKALQG